MGTRSLYPLAEVLDYSWLKPENNASSTFSRLYTAQSRT